MNHRNLILDTADLVDVALEDLTTASMARMEALLDQIERAARAVIMPATAPT